MAHDDTRHEVVWEGSGRGSSTGITVSHIDFNDRRMLYHSCSDPIGTFRGRTTNGKTFVHEVLGHQTDSWLDIVLGGLGIAGEQHAIDVENIYNRANGAPARCGSEGSPQQ